MEHDIELDEDMEYDDCDPWCHICNGDEVWPDDYEENTFNEEEDD